MPGDIGRMPRRRPRVPLLLLLLLLREVEVRWLLGWQWAGRLAAFLSMLLVLGNVGGLGKAGGEVLLVLGNGDLVLWRTRLCLARGLKVCHALLVPVLLLLTSGITRTYAWHGRRTCARLGRVVPRCSLPAIMTSAAVPLNAAKARVMERTSLRWLPLGLARLPRGLVGSRDADILTG